MFLENLIVSHVVIESDNTKRDSIAALVGLTLGRLGWEGFTWNKVNIYFKYIRNF